jgi:hypothetical protein
MPLNFQPLENAIELKKSGALKFQGRKHGRNDSMSDFYAESTYLLLSNSRSSGGAGSTRLSDQGNQRTGRWTEEEIAFVDFLVSAFDKGRLPLPHGIKLNDFLGDILLCKSSRLTKKMKNAKFSTRSYVLSRPEPAATISDCVLLSVLQEKFLMSIPSKPTQLEVRFNMMKQWRTHFSNLCVQVGYQFLDGADWVSSLEEMERRSSCVEDNIRKSRRRQMGLALQTDGGHLANPSVFISGVKADLASTHLEPLDLTQGPEIKRSRVLSMSGSENTSQSNKSDEVIQTLDTNSVASFSPLFQSQQQSARPRNLSIGTSPLFQSREQNERQRTFSEDFDAVLNDLLAPEEEADAVPLQASGTSSAPSSHSCGPFLDAVVNYMETKNMPFQHVDVWVPSFLPRDNGGPSKAVDTEQLRLFHAGYSTRADIDGSEAYSFNEFGVYSEKFSFKPGHGLPGRVYSSGKASWESSLWTSNPTVFERAGGAKIYGVETALGIPLKTPLVGRIVVIMYSNTHIKENLNLAKECAMELVNLSPEPKWKIVIETKIGGTSNQQNSLKKVSTATPPVGVQSQVGDGGRTPLFEQSQAVSASDEERAIVSLLGEHMPLNENPAGEPSSSSTKTSELLPHFMSIRLTLLRPSNRRSVQENELIAILKCSYRAYAKDNRRSGAELAMLLAKDWVCLKSSLDNSSDQAPQTLKQSSFTEPLPAENPFSPKPPIAKPSISSEVGSGQQIMTYDHSKVHRREPSFSDISSASGEAKPISVRSANLENSLNRSVVTPNVISES